MLATIVFAAVVVIIGALFFFRRHAPESHPWDITDPKSFDETRVGGLNEYPGTFSFEIAGESYYQQALSEICGGRTEAGHEMESPALLVPYRNDYDSEAVAVLMGDCQLVGHLSRRDAKKVRSAMRNIGLDGCSLRVPALIVGGWDRGPNEQGHFGVKLDLPT